jgi:predicted ribosomally synthesized peptide with SipW-like signal peptide
MVGSDFELDISRRHALAALGSIGAASLGVGIGTSAFFSDQETFANNRLAAGTLDMRVAYEEHYSDWSDDEATGVTSVEMVDTVAPADRIGLPTNESTPRNGSLITVANESEATRFLNNTVDSTYPEGYDAANPPANPCTTLPDGSDTPPAAIELTDVKPGDFGEVTFSFALCDNPGFVWLQGEQTAAAESDPDSDGTNVTEPEADDPDEDQYANGTLKEPDPNAPGRTTELLDVVRAAVWVDDGNNFQNGSEQPVVIDSLRNVLAMATSDGIPLAGDRPAAEAGGEGRNCFSATTVHDAVFAWWLPVDHANEIQTDYVAFDLGFYTEQCRHNDGRRLVGAWSQTRKLTATPATSEAYFGSAVDIDGPTLAIGADGADTTATDAGAVHIVDAADGWTQTDRLVASDGAASEYFGEAVAVGSDVVVVGAPGDENGTGETAGAAYVFERTESGWTETKLTAGGAGASFGQSVAVAGGTVAIGADGVTHAGEDEAGAVYLFEPTESDWVQTATLTPTSPTAQGYFGVRTALNDAGTRLLVSAYGDDRAGENAGAVFIFEDDDGGSGAWTQTAVLTASDAGANDYFGSDIGLDGQTIVCGAFGDDDDGTDAGAVYVFTLTESGWTEVTKLTASDGSAQMFFGWQTAIHDGTILVGAYRDDERAVDAGAAYIYQRQESAWQELTKLTPADATEQHRFGVTGAIGERGIVAAATGDQSNGPNTGAVYVFQS